MAKPIHFCTPSLREAGNHKRLSGPIATGIGLAISLCLLLAPADVQSRSKQKPHANAQWSHEPVSFLSLPLGGSLQTNKQCVASQTIATREVTSTSPNPCWQGESNVKTFYELPSPGFSLDSVIAVTNDDRIGTIIVNGMRPEYAAMKSYLIDTYGAPTQSQMKPMGQQGGLMLGVENLRWEGKYVAIQLEEIYNRVDMFRVVVIHKPSTLHTAMLTQ
jgi:hypothetical protein